MGLQIELLEQSFAAVAPQAEELADRFYERLFREYPQVKPLFAKTDMAQQKKHLIVALSLVVNNLRKPDDLTKAVWDLGLRHVDYGVQRSQYPIVGKVLSETLAEITGDTWSAELECAWGDAYSAIQTVIYHALDDHEAKTV